MSFQLYSFHLLSAFVGTTDSSQQSQRNTYTANVTLTVKPERQLEHGFISKSQGSNDSNYVLLIHTGPQQLVRLYLAEFVQTGGQPMPYDLEHRESRNAIRLRYEPSLGERCQVGAEFTKRSDFVQAAQLLERLGLRFRGPDQARATSRSSDLRPSQTSPQPLSISPPASSLSNRRAGSTLSVSQRSWSPMPWPSASPPSSQPNFLSDHLPARRPLSILSLPHPRSESPASASALPAQSQLSQSNLFIAQDVSRLSLPPTSFSQGPSVPSTRGSGSPFLDHESHVGRAPRSEAEEPFPSQHHAPAATSPRRSSSAFSRLSQLQQSLSDDLESMMPPPRQLPFQSKKPKVILTTRNDHKEGHGITDMSEARSGSLLRAPGSTQTRPEDRQVASPHRSSLASEITADKDSKISLEQPLKTVDERDNLDGFSARRKRLMSGPDSASVDKKGPTRQRGLADQPGRWSKRLRNISPENSFTDGENAVEQRQPRDSSKKGKMQKDADNRDEEVDAEHTLGLNGDTVTGKKAAEVSIENTDKSRENTSISPRRSRRKKGVQESAWACPTSNNAETQTEDTGTYNNCASACDIRPPAQAAGTQTHSDVTDTGIACDLRPSTRDKGILTDSATQIVDVSHQRRQQSFHSVGVQVEHPRHQSTTLGVPSDVGVQTHVPILCASTQTGPFKGRRGRGFGPDGMVFVAALRLVDEAKDLMHQHIDSDLDRLEAGLEVDLERSVGEMLQAVERLAQKALDEHGDDMLQIPFELIARDYLNTREAAIDL